MANPTPPPWPHCGDGADPTSDRVGCRGVHVRGYDRCLAHLDPDDRAAYLATLTPGANVDHRGTPFTESLLTALLRPLRGPATDRYLLGIAQFGGATFTGDAWFNNATFTLGRFNEATFTGDAWFSGATFTDDASFGGATFKQKAQFGGATFTGDAQFDQFTFARKVTFTGDAEVDPRGWTPGFMRRVTAYAT
ncbi:pentapeptide repeat-containing protein [Streptomyces maoxianensis]|uniref:Pentapeptide repeat-containing protein n=1 Tax=Streptomyces maoxianensis TaxID=1459942 RepID=A0ABV9GEH0_9ACTN